ncbi:class I SAM-dependent methyltransferase [Pantoea endophytica]|uniref:class I SAM-dependent methyltransferase n=1 Tax=Pantoea endophytica TaxID=92488 RepID=UPI001AE30B7A|nr:class I SAM-dependent methyltransferase [Pantoea endophytica]
MNKLKDLYQQHEGKSSDKWDIYLSVYDEYLKDKRSAISNILEIGVQNGGSLEIWSKYFTSAKNLVGCDINPACKKLEFSHSGIKVVVGDSSTLKIKNEISSLSSSFDLIIDDGSHTSSDIIKSFLLYFPLVNNDGYYIIEDLHASYWERFEGGLFYPYSSMSFLKKLADIPNKEHWGSSLSESDYLSPFYQFYDCESFDAVDYTQIHSVTFVNSLCIIKKKSIENNLLGARYIAGDVFDVSANQKSIHGDMINVPPQDKNIWSKLKTFPEFEWAELLTKEKNNEVNSLSTLVESTHHDFELRIKLMQDEINEKNNDVIAHEKLILQLTNRNNELLNSTSWRITKPLRAIMKKIRGK